MDPKNPDTWTPEQRVDYLASLGLKWVSGNGANAIWEAPDGKRYSEQTALDTTLGVYQEGKSLSGGTPSQIAPDRTAQIGIDPSSGDRRYFTIGTNGAPVWGPLAPATGGSAGLTFEQQQQLAATPRVSISQSVADPRSIALQQQQLAQAAEQWQKSFDQTVATAAQVHADKQQELQQAGMINMYNIAFNDKKQAFAEASDNAHLAQQAQQISNDLAYKQADIQLRQQTLNYQFATFNAQAANEAAKFNAQMAFNVQQANQQFESQKQDRLAAIATNLGTLAQDTGDRGKLAGALTGLAWGGANAATSGKDYRTTESLTPLESELRTQQDVKNSTAPYSYQPVQAQQVAMPTLAAMMTPQSPAAPTTPAAPGVSQPAATPTGIDYSPAAQQARIEASRAAGSGAGGGGFDSAATGGVLTNAMRRVGERGPELQIDLADGRTMVLNDKQQQALRKAGLDLTEHTAGYAAGGLFDSALSNVPDSNRDLSNSFLSEAYQRAVSGTPWAGQKQLPSPVWFSSPGTNPLALPLGASLKALGEGVPADTTTYLANLYRPVGAREMVTGRTR